MKPEAKSSYPVHELIIRRWSPRAFKNQHVEEEDLRVLFEAARWAPSSRNEQPWRYLVTLNGTAPFDKLLDTLSDSNQEWARYAPVLGMTISKKTFTGTDKENRHYQHDAGLAMGNLLAQATALGLHVHQMAGFNPGKVRESFHIPDDFEPLTAFVVGYLGDPSTLSEKNKKSEVAPRERKHQSEFVFIGEWGKSQ